MRLRLRLRCFGFAFASLTPPARDGRGDGPREGGKRRTNIVAEALGYIEPRANDLPLVINALFKLSR